MIFSCNMNADAYTAIFGSAIGDAMGAPIERLNIAKQDFKTVYRHGIAKITDLRPTDWMHTSAEKVIPYTDDTAMALDTLIMLLITQDCQMSMQDTTLCIASRYIDSMHIPDGWAASFRLPGVSTLKNMRKAEENRANTQPSEAVWYNPLSWGQKKSSLWWQAGGREDGGCGSVMRTYPFGIIFADDPEKAALWAVEHSKITHGAPIALAACAAMATGVAYALQGQEPLFIVQVMENAARVYDAKTADMIAQARAFASMESITPEQIFAQWPGWAAHDAIASTVYVFLKHPDDLEKALVLGANMYGDSDSIASMAGALVGARCDRNALPAEWVEHLENKTYITMLANKVIGLQHINWKSYSHIWAHNRLPLALCKKSVHILYAMKNASLLPIKNPEDIVAALEKVAINDEAIAIDCCARTLRFKFNNPGALLCMAFIYVRSPIRIRDAVRDFFAGVERMSGDTLSIDYLKVLEANAELLSQLQAMDDEPLMQSLVYVFDQVAAHYKNLDSYAYPERKKLGEKIKESLPAQ